MRVHCVFRVKRDAIHDSPHPTATCFRNRNVRKTMANHSVSQMCPGVKLISGRSNLNGVCVRVAMKRACIRCEPSIISVFFIVATTNRSSLSLHVKPNIWTAIKMICIHRIFPSECQNEWWESWPCVNSPKADKLNYKTTERLNVQWKFFDDFANVEWLVQLACVLTATR